MQLVHEIFTGNVAGTGKVIAHPYIGLVGEGEVGTEFNLDRVAAIVLCLRGDGELDAE